MYSSADSSMGAAGGVGSSCEAQRAASCSHGEQGTGSRGKGKAVKTVTTLGGVDAVAATAWIQGKVMDDATRVIKKGDMVRVLDRPYYRIKGREIKFRDGGLAKVQRVRQVDEAKKPNVPDGTENVASEERPTPQECYKLYHYDLEWLLGGRLNHVKRHEFIYTTAEAEGLTGNSCFGGNGGERTDGEGCGGARSSRRKRKPSSVAAEEERRKEEEAQEKERAKKEKEKEKERNKKKQMKQQIAAAKTPKKRKDSKSKGKGPKKAKSMAATVKVASPSIKKRTHMLPRDGDWPSPSKSLCLAEAKAKKKRTVGKPTRPVLKKISGSRKATVGSLSEADAAVALDGSECKGVGKKTGGNSKKRRKPGGMPSTASSDTVISVVRAECSGSAPRADGSGTAPEECASSAAVAPLVAAAKDPAEVYERHRREFERALERLERVDPFGFFLGDPPEGMDEEYEDEDANANKSSESNDHDGYKKRDSFGQGHVPCQSKSSLPSGECGDKGVMAEAGGEGVSHIDKSSIASIAAQPAEPSGVPTNVYRVPPFNFSVIRKRLARGRYILDRITREKERRQRILAFRSLSGSVVSGREEQTSNNIGSSDVRGLSVIHAKGIDWDTFRDDIMSMCDAAISRDPRGVSGKSGTLGHASMKIKRSMETIHGRTGRRHLDEMDLDEVRVRCEYLTAGNTEAAVQSDWRKNAFPERVYERLNMSNVVCSGLSELDRRSAEYELLTSLPDSFVGQPYNYDDLDQSEEWMKSFGGKSGGRPRSRKKGSGKDGKEDESEEAKVKRTAAALATDDGVVRAQVQNTLHALLIEVQEKCMTEDGILRRPELRSVNGEESISQDEPSGLSPSSLDGAIAEPAEVAENAVWGIDCYTRRNITRCLSEEFGSSRSEEFVEKWLLPAINACPVSLAHDIKFASRILEGEDPSKFRQTCKGSNGGGVGTGSASVTSVHQTILGRSIVEKVSMGPPWLKDAARQLRLASLALGEDAFRVHPKGHGAIVVKKGGIPAHTLVTHYRGEVYPAWRWGEKMDAIEETQARMGLRPALADFYNMTLERPRKDPRGYGLLFVDASRKAGFGSSFSHSCSPTCEVRVVADKGKLSLALTTTRDIEQGEELAFDYNAVTESLTEYMSAVCLCGHMNCRGSFLHFATADCYQQVLERNSPIAVRLASLIRACTKGKIAREDANVLSRHGFGRAAFGAVSYDKDDDAADSEHMDSMHHVPVWLQTFVADTLRYIEYERRALPVALLCSHISKAKSGLKSDQAPNKGAKSRKRPRKKNPKGSEKVNSKKANLIDGVYLAASQDSEGVIAVVGGNGEEAAASGNGGCGKDSRGSFLRTSEKVNNLSSNAREKLLTEANKPPEGAGATITCFLRNEEKQGCKEREEQKTILDSARDEACAGTSSPENGISFRTTFSDKKQVGERPAKAAKKCQNPLKKEEQRKSDVHSSVSDEKNEKELLKKAVRGSKPTTSFMFFSVKKKDEFVAILEERGRCNLKGVGLTQAIQKVAGEVWGKLTVEEKISWGKAAVADWERSGGKERAKLEENRKLKLKQMERDEAAEKMKVAVNESKMKQRDEEAKRMETETNTKQKAEQKAIIEWERVEAEARSSNHASCNTPSISFVAADSEGRAAMEQRIQALTQTLSRVGRVLYRHREMNKHASGGGNVHPPLCLLSDGEVIYHLWNRRDGVVRSLLQFSIDEPCVSCALKEGIAAIACKYSHLCEFDGHNAAMQAPAIEARRCLTNALLEFRRCILTALKMAEDDEQDEVLRKKRGEALRKKSGAVTEKGGTPTAALGKDDPIAFASPKDDRQPSEEGSEKADLCGELPADPSFSFPCSSTSPCNQASNDLREENVFMEEDSVKSGAIENVKASFSAGGYDAKITKDGSVDAVEECGATLEKPIPAIFSASCVSLSDHTQNVSSENGNKIGEISDLESPVLPFHGAENPVKCMEPNAKSRCDTLLHTSESCKAECIAQKKLSSKPISSPCDNGCKAMKEPDDEMSDFDVKSPSLPERRQAAADSEVNVCRSSPRTDVTLMSPVPTFSFELSPTSEPVLPREEFIVRKYRLEAAADLLLMYAHTSTFLTLRPYAPFESTPINVYARELGNQVPRALVEEATEYGASTTGKCESLEFHRNNKSENEEDSKYDEKCSVQADGDSVNEDKHVYKESIKSSSCRGSEECVNDDDGTNSVSSQKSASKKKKAPSGKSASRKKNATASEYCKPEEPVTSVVRKYSGDYLFTQLLQWFNAGIGTKPGLPGMLGCATLPSVESCWNTDEVLTTCTDCNDSEILFRPEDYMKDIQPLLIEWLENRVSRGSPLPPKVRAFFGAEPTIPNECEHRQILMGSPVLDSLVTGDESNIRLVLHGLKNRTSHGGNGEVEVVSKGKTRAERLQSKVDEGMPPQAVSNWVRCENQDCMKWRKLPWHVDMQMLPEKFFCADNIWNPNSNSCDKPADPWDANQETTASCRLGNITEKDLRIKERFDVFRKKSKRYLEAEVIETDFETEVKKVKFHFLRLQRHQDEWIEVGSPRITPLNSFTTKKKPKKRAPVDQTEGNSDKERVEAKNSVNDDARCRQSDSTEDCLRVEPLKQEENVSKVDKFSSEALVANVLAEFQVKTGPKGISNDEIKASASQKCSGVPEISASALLCTTMPSIEKDDSR